MCEELWVFCDGSDIESIIFHRNRVRSDHTVLVSINISHQLLFALGTFDSVLDLQDIQSSSLWGQLHKKKSPPKKQKNPIIFLSHAVADEAQWLPAFHELRHVLGHTIFSCSDSIVSGSN